MQFGAIYDGEAAARCLASMQALPETCVGLLEAHTNVVTQCSQVINGPISPGDPCESVEECARADGAQGSTLTGF